MFELIVFYEDGAIQNIENVLKIRATDVFVLIDGDTFFERIRKDDISRIEINLKGE